MSKRERLLITRSSPCPPSSSAPPPLVGTGARLIHVQRPSLHLFAVHPADGSLSFFFYGHLDESESLGLVAELIFNDGSGRNLPESLKSLSQILFSDGVRQIAYVNVHCFSPYLTFGLIYQIFIKNPEPFLKGSGKKRPKPDKKHFYHMDLG
jgi:hypothetical protein